MALKDCANSPDSKEIFLNQEHRATLSLYCRGLQLRTVRWKRGNKLKSITILKYRQNCKYLFNIAGSSVPHLMSIKCSLWATDCFLFLFFVSLSSYLGTHLAVFVPVSVSYRQRAAATICYKNPIIVTAVRYVKPQLFTVLVTDI